MLRTVILLALAACCLAADPVDLRGYGRVAATVLPERSEFACESASKADLLLGKLIADLFWDAGEAHQVQRLPAPGGGAITVHVTPVGALAVGRLGDRVLAFGGADASAALAAAVRDGRLAKPGAVFASTGYPIYLDTFDLKAMSCYTMGLHPENRHGLAARRDFIGRFFNGGMQFSCLSYLHSPAPGVMPGYPLADTDFALAERSGQMLSMAVGTGAWPTWARDADPEQVDRHSGDSLETTDWVSIWNPEALGLPSQRRRATSLGFLAEVMWRYRDRPNLGAWQLYVGDYFYETYFHRPHQGRVGYTANGLADFRRWLREERKLDLRSLGERWHGDPVRYARWEDVPLPLLSDADADPAQSLRLTEGWRWRAADKDETAPPAGEAGWVPVRPPPCDEAWYLPRGRAYWRTTIDATAWLAARSASAPHLLVDHGNLGWKVIEVWLNGEALGRFASTSDPYAGAVAVPLTGKLKPGANTLAIAVPEGVIRGPVRLCAEAPPVYPFLGRQRNAQYVDAMEWRLAAYNAKVEEAMTTARAIDPDRPLVMCATSVEVRDPQGMALHRLGGGMHDTGYESSYRPFNARLGYAGGFYGTNEDSGLPRPSTPQDPDPAVWDTCFDRTLGWLLHNGDGMHIFWRDPYCYFELEKRSHWFTRNQRGLDLVGKALPVQPKVALLLASQTALLDARSYASFWEWNIGRGELDAAHYDNVFVTEGMLADGLADEYPVLFDTNTRFMTAETVQAIRRYVERGGTFIALHETGRHTPLDADAWPISGLTGFTATPGGRRGTVTFGTDLPLMKDWAGKRFAGDGAALNWKDEDVAKGAGVGLAPAAGDCVALATWDDGSVAVGLRRVGKGRVITLGSTFWRWGRDVGGAGVWQTTHVATSFFERLFTELGAPRTADATSREVFARQFTTKNGLERWLVSMNNSERPATAAVAMACPERPRRLWDAVTRREVPFTWADGWLRVAEAPYRPWEWRVYACDRTSLAGGIDVWWAEKLRFWRRVQAVAPLSRPTSATAAFIATPTTLVVQEWAFQPDRDGGLGRAGEWSKPEFDDRAWRSIGNEAWNLRFDDLKDYGGTALYRSRPFAVPAAWQGHRITLNLNGYVRHMGGGWRAIRFTCNGQPLAEFPRSLRQADITALLKPEGNVIGMAIDGRDPNAAEYPLSGLFEGLVWMQIERRLEPVIDLAGAWQAVPAGWAEDRPTVLPGAVRAHHLWRTVAVPAEWKGRQVLVRVRNPERFPGELRQGATDLHGANLMVNGRMIPLYDFNHAHYTREDAVNVTPYLRFGADNRLELWPQANERDPGKERDLEFAGIEIGCLAP